MAEDAAVETITLVAVEMGFAMNRMVAPGEHFQFAVHDRNGKARKLPKWAALPADYKPKAKPVTGDLKPKAAQAAVKAKAGALSGATES